MRRHKNRPDTSALCHIGLNAVLTRRRLEQLALHTDVITVPRGTLLARAGAVPMQFVAVIDGVVDVIDVAGETHVAGPGTHIGGTEVFHRRPHKTTVATRTACLVVVISGRASAFRHAGVADWVEAHRTVTQRAAEVAGADTTRPLALVD